jgi:2-polyprenyl-3-methyl-5-hydroxy-6-metoxy-1,4-benzoquinol methylase
MWEALKYRVKKVLGMPLPLKPFECVREREAEQFGLYQESNGELFPGYRITPSDVVVDVGCGDGAALLFAAKQGAEVIGVDIDPSAIELTNKRLRAEASSQRWQTHVSDSNPLPLTSGVASKVICQEVLEHVDDPAVVVSELVRIGKPGSLYLLSVPDPIGESIHREIAPPFYWAKPYHLRIFEREAFERLVKGAGLTIVRRASFSFFWSMWWMLLWAEPRAKGECGRGITPVLRYWNKTWDALLAAPEGQRVKKALDNFMPKNQFIVARKAA